AHFSLYPSTGSSPARTAAWHRCAARSRKGSYVRWRRARHWRGKGTAEGKLAPAFGRRIAPLPLPPSERGVPACLTAPPSPPPRGGLQLDARNTSHGSIVIAALSASKAAAGRLAGSSTMLEAPSRRGLGGDVGLAEPPSRRGRGGAVHKAVKPAAGRRHSQYAQ